MLRCENVKMLMSQETNELRCELGTNFNFQPSIFNFFGHELHE